MFKKSLYPIFLLALSYILFSSDDARIIIAGVAIFLVGMVFMEDGFKLSAGGVLEKTLRVSTNSLPRAVGTGFLATAIVQSSSLVTVIIISFLSADLIGLNGAIGVMFGSNVGTTATAWIVSTFGLKIKIAHLALPILIFGVVFRFHKHKNYQAVGNIFIGLGFVFLGIGYMKDGFEELKEGFVLTKYAMEGLYGMLVYVLLGAVATVIIQSSSATMALIITALATNQVLYINALELAIGANIGTTVTAIIASLASNNNGKRLAIAHLIFNIFTAFIALIFLYQLADIVDMIAIRIGIEDDLAMKLALFHTIFNVLGIVLMIPLLGYLVRYLDGLFSENTESVSRARYLDSSVIEVPKVAIEALKKEVEHLYNNATEVLSHALSLHRHKFFGLDEEKIVTIVKKSVETMDTNIDDFYEKKIKSLYGDIIHFATISQENMSLEEQHNVYALKTASRDIVEAIKDIKEIQKNVNRYINSNNENIKNEYNHIRKEIAKTLDAVHIIQNSSDDFEALAKIKLIEENLEKLDIIRTGRIDKLIRNNEIDFKMATSLINDSSFAYEISKRIIQVAKVLWIENIEIQELGEV